MDSFGNIGSEWNRRMTGRLPWRGPGFPMYQPSPLHNPMMGLFRQPPPAHLSETIYVAERTGQKVRPQQNERICFFHHVDPKLKTAMNLS